MTQERFLAFLEEPEKLASVSYQELKTLALAYPYAASLRVLLLLKSHQEGNAEKLQNLATASAYVPDRARLFQLISPKVAIVRASEAIADEFVLELKPLAEAEKALLERAFVETPIEKQETAFAQVAEPHVSPVAPKKETTADIDAPQVDPPQKKLQKTAPKPISLDELAKKQPETGIKDGFSSIDFQAWANQFLLPALKAKVAKTTAPPVVELFPKPVETRQSPPASKAEQLEAKHEARQDPVKAIAELSVSEKREIVSETLAKVFAKQGYRDKAIDMYERLAVVFPQKKTTFAAEIEKLRQTAGQPPKP